MNIHYEVEQIPNGHRVSAFDSAGVLRWAKSYFRERSNQGYADHSRKALEQAKVDCAAAIERARQRTMSEITINSPTRGYTYGAQIARPRKVV